MVPDEAAFYGPKIDVKLVDAIGRPWQLSTVQFDFTLPRRFELEYIGEDGKTHQPLMVHRALYGSIERFFGILIEHYAGAFPVWLAPVQAIVLPITDRQTEYARGVQKQLDAAGIRATVDDRSEKVNLKIREAQLQKIPYMLVVGDREQQNGQVAVRNRKHGDQGAQPVAECIAAIRKLIEARRSRSSAAAKPCRPLRRYLFDARPWNVHGQPGRRVAQSTERNCPAVCKPALDHVPFEV